MNCTAALLQVRGRARGALSLCGWEVWAGYRAKSSCPVVTVGPAYQHLFLASWCGPKVVGAQPAPCVTFGSPWRAYGG